MKKGLIIGGGVLGLLVLSVIVKQFMVIVPEKSTYSNECDRVYQETGECSSDRCEFLCDLATDIGDNCDKRCIPKDCSRFSPEVCPVEICQVTKACDGNSACRAIADGQRQCGEEGYFGQDVECCSGLVRKCGKLTSDGLCDPQSGGYQKLPSCIPCGNGICEKYENKCNCPEDCTE